MSLREATQVRRADTRRKCGVGDWIRTLPQDEQDAAAELLNDSYRPTTEVHDAFAGEGLTLGYAATARHRNGRCACH